MIYRQIMQAIIQSVLVFTLPATSLLNAAEVEDPAEVQIGERLFLETRFAQSYFAKRQKKPETKITITTSGKLPGPFRGQSINCRSCHFVDEHKRAKGAGMRTYADFARTSPVPDRHLKPKRTLRNSQMMVNINAKGKSYVLLHHDGEFTKIEDLVQATLTGRNFGWKATEFKTAIRHIASIIRRDNGTGQLAQEFGGSYRKLLLGTNRAIPAKLRLPSAFRIDVNTASDKKIVKTISRLIAVYVRSLEFSRDHKGVNNGSPYDLFLRLNKLPRTAGKGESDKNYSQRLLVAINKMRQPVFVTSKHGKFKLHKQPFKFGKKQLTGLKLFLAKGIKQRRGGNCAACHAAPHFTDFSFHNTGLTQVNYDRIHGKRAFKKLYIPKLSKRNKNYNKYLPVTVRHPFAKQPFRSALSHAKPGHLDLGLWNVFANPDMPAPQHKITKLLCDQYKRIKPNKKFCKNQSLLPLAIASFKTPSLRDLGHSNPYMHSGQFDSLKQAVSFYLTSSMLAKTKNLRNAAPELKHIVLTGKDVNAIVAFLKSLNEDYE